MNREICLSISGHHEETWQPAWGIRTALVALRAFMDTDARGQLGGLESSVAERERRAEESSNWRCSICARSNGEIIKECEEASKEKEGNAEEVEIPKELKMGWKDEMGKEKEEDNGGDTEAELAEGFVRTAEPVADSSASTNSYPAARPAQGVAQPTASIPQPQAMPPNPTSAAQLQNGAPARTQVAQRRSNEGVPIWIDRAIAGIVLCLVFMVFKVLLG